MAEPRRTFGPVVLLGVAGAGLAAVAGHRTWARPEGGDAGEQGLAHVAVSTGSGVGESPAAGAFALVALAAWGVLLVTRGRVRRAVALLAGLAAVAVLVTVAVGWSAVPDGVRDAVAALGVGEPQVERTWWYWATALGALLALAAALLALRLAPAWPEMGRRYDAPTGAAATPSAATPEERSNLELWKAMDEGEDPTA